MPWPSGVGDDEDLAVGEDAVDVEDEDFDVFCAGFSGHLTMIPWRAIGPARHGIEGFFSLTPVTFYPDVAVAVMVPVAGDPAGMGMGWFHVGSGDPDVAWPSQR